MRIIKLKSVSAALVHCWPFSWKKNAHSTFYTLPRFDTTESRASYARDPIRNEGAAAQAHFDQHEHVVSPPVYIRSYILDRIYAIKNDGSDMYHPYTPNPEPPAIDLSFAIGLVPLHAHKYIPPCKLVHEPVADLLLCARRVS